MVETASQLGPGLPAGITVVPARRPADLAAELTEHVSGRLCPTVRDAERILAQRTLASHRLARSSRDTAETAWLEGLLEGRYGEIPEVLVRSGATARLRRLADELAAARQGVRAAEAAVDELPDGLARLVRAGEDGPAAPPVVEPELVERAARRTVDARAEAKQHYAGLGKKPTLGPAEAATARAAISRVEDASFGAERARTRLQRTLAAGNVLGVLLAFFGVVSLLAGADMDAPQVYALLGLAGCCPIIGLLIGAAGVAAARRRVRNAQHERDRALAELGLRSAAELAARRAELEAWLARADATAAARDEWRAAQEAWEALAGPDVDPADAGSLVVAATEARSRRNRVLAAQGRLRLASQGLEAATGAVTERLAELAAGGPGGDGPAPEARPLVVLGTPDDEASLRRLAGTHPVALVISAFAPASRTAGPRTAGPRTAGPHTAGPGPAPGTPEPSPSPVAAARRAGAAPDDVVARLVRAASTGRPVLAPLRPTALNGPVPAGAIELDRSAPPLEGTAPPAGVAASATELALERLRRLRRDRPTA